MRRWRAMGLLVCLWGVTPAWGQFPFGGFGGGGSGNGSGRGFGGMFANPDFIFNFLSKGKDTIDRRELDPQFRGMADRFFSMAGITSDVITRDQFKTAIQKVTQQFASGGGAAMMGMSGGGFGGLGGPGGGRPGPGGFGRGDRGFNPDTIAERIFQRADADGDGLLKIEEMPESLAIERDKWDTNNDGFIDLREYREFFAARRQQIESERAAANAANLNSASEPPTDPAERRPMVYRSTNLPRELPSWFAQADANQDAQVSLLEWRGTGMPIEQFKNMDRNGDNLLTVEEVLAFQKLNRGASMVASSGGSDAAPNFGFGGFGAGRGGFGGFGGFGGLGGSPGGGLPFGGSGGDRAGRGGFGGFGGFGGLGGSPGGGFPFGGSGGDRGGRGGDRGANVSSPNGFGFPTGGFGGDRNNFRGNRGFPGGDNQSRGGRNRGG